jgi:hypothetical protein
MAWVEQFRVGLEPHWARMQAVWSRLGFAAEEQAGRSQEVVAHLCSLLNDLASEEEKQLNQILTLIQENRIKVIQLAEELQVDPALPPAAAELDTSLLRIDAALEAKRVELEELREERLEEKIALESRADALAHSLVLSPSVTHSIVADTDISQPGLQRLRSKISEFERELQERKEAVVPTVATIKALSRELQYEAEDEFETLALARADTVPLSVPNIERLRQLQHKLESQKTRLNEDVSHAWARLKARWTELEVSAEAQAAVCKALRLPTTRKAPSARDPTPTASGETLAQLRQEHRRLDQLQRAMLPKILARRFAELQQLWAQCYRDASELDTLLETWGCPFTASSADWSAVDNLDEVRCRRGRERRGSATATTIAHLSRVCVCVCVLGDSSLQVLVCLDEELGSTRSHLGANQEIFKAVEIIEAHRVRPRAPVYLFQPNLSRAPPRPFVRHSATCSLWDAREGVCGRGHRGRPASKPRRPSGPSGEVHQERPLGRTPH